MGTRFRWVLFCIFALFFMASGTVLIMAAQGYRYHFAKQRIEKTGEIFVDTKPKGARLLIDEQVRGRPLETPVRVSGILSGQYTIRLGKDGFFPWMRTVTVSAGQTTLVRDVSLVRSDSIQLVAHDPSIRFIAAMSSNRVAIITATDVIEVDRVSGKQRLLLRTSDEIRDVPSNPRGEGFFIATDKSVWVFNSQGRSTHVRLGDIPAVAARWSADGSMITALTSRGFALFQDPARPQFVLKGAVRHAVLDHDGISAVFDKNPSELAHYNLRGSRAVPDGQTLVSRSIRRILAVQGDRVVVDYGNSALGIIDLGGGRQKNVTLHGGEHAFLLESGELITWNEFELYRTTFQDDGFDTPELLARQSVPIRDVRLLSHIGYLAVLSSDGSLRLIELTGSGTQNRYILQEKGVRVKKLITLRSRDLLMLREGQKEAVVEIVQLSSQ